jgi:hypothetical protein
VARVAAIEGLVGGAVKLVDLSQGMLAEPGRSGADASRLRARLGQRLAEAPAPDHVWRDSAEPAEGETIGGWPGSARRLGGVLE